MKIQIQRHGFFLVLISVFFVWRRAESIRFDLESGHTKCISEDIKSNSMTVGKYQIVNPNEGHPLPESHKVTVREVHMEFPPKVNDKGLDFRAVVSVGAGGAVIGSGREYDYLLSNNYRYENTEPGGWSLNRKKSGSAGWSKETKELVTSAYGNSYHYSDHVTEGHFAFQAVEAGDYMCCFFASDHRPSTTITIDFDWKSGVASKDWTSVAKKGSVELMEIELKKMFDTVQSIHEEMFYLREREDEMQRLNRSTNSKMFWFSFLSILVCLSVAGLQLWHLKSFFEKKKLI